MVNPFKISAWTRIARPEYLPIVLLLFATGTAAGALDARSFDLVRALLACGCLLLIQLAAMLTNEHFDYPGDVLARETARFSGGSRVLVTGALSHEEVLRGVVVSVALLGALSGILLATSPTGVRTATLLVLTFTLALGLGHSAPPVRLSHRGMGEINAAFTHTVLPALTGWVVQGGPAADPLPWLVAMPAFCALFAARTLAGIPDVQADAATGRRTYAVAFGARGAAIIAMCGVAAACTGGVLLWQDRIVSGWYARVYLATIPHALLLVWQTAAVVRSGSGDRPLDGLILNALLFTLWFGLIPFAYFVKLVGS